MRLILIPRGSSIQIVYITLTEVADISKLDNSISPTKSIPYVHACNLCSIHAHVTVGLYTF